MSQITTGIRSILSQSVMYDLFQDIMGARNGRKDFADNYVQAFENARVLDIGCGTARILDYLPKKIHYYGFDLSQQYITTAKKQYGSKNTVFSCSIVDQLTIDSLPPFDIVIASGLLHHLGDQEAGELVYLAHQALRDGGIFATKDPCYAKHQNAVSSYLISCDRGKNVRTAAGYKDLASTMFSQVTGTVKHQSWIPYTHFNMECRK